MISSSEAVLIGKRWVGRHRGVRIPVRSRPRAAHMITSSDIQPHGDWLHAYRSCKRIKAMTYKSNTAATYDNTSNTT